MRTFSGGIHPPQSKNTKDKPIEKADLPKKVVIPLQQHSGCQAEPVVSVGDMVKTGQKIGEAKAFISANIHSSITGKIESIKKGLSPILRDGWCITIEGDGTDEWVTSQKNDLDKLSPEEIRQKIKDAGIVGLGGAGFPTHVKLCPPCNTKVDTVIINGAECESYLTCDNRLMIERTNEIIEGLEIIKKAVGAKNGYIAIEDNKPKAIEKVKSAVKGSDKVFVLKTKYPQGAEKQLIKVILSREVPSCKLPLDVGVVVDNVGTAVAVRNAVLENKPLVERVITVCGSGISTERNLLVRIGTSFKDIIDQCGGFKKDVWKVIMGGPMMGLSQFSLDIPVIKGTSGILAMTLDERPDLRERNCIRCGRCVAVCPMHLMPNMLGLYSARFMMNEGFKYNPEDCIECGSCAYVCPAKIPLVQLIRFVKGKKLEHLRCKSELLNRK
ncbi:MAG: electron transport complex subunit RsxC [bacterium]|nr:electron transport complex subunit RsxC [bacterium]